MSSSQLRLDPTQHGRSSARPKGFVGANVASSVAFREWMICHTPHGRRVRRRKSLGDKPTRKASRPVRAALGAHEAGIVMPAGRPVQHQPIARISFAVPRSSAWRSLVRAWPSAVTGEEAEQRTARADALMAVVEGQSSRARSGGRDATVRIV